MPGACLGLALPRSVATGLSVSLPVFLRKVSSCIVFLTQRCYRLQGGLHSHRNPGTHQHRTSFQALSCQHSKGLSRCKPVCFKPREPFSSSLVLLTCRERTVQCPLQYRARCHVLVSVPCRLPLKSQDDIPPPTRRIGAAQEASSAAPGVWPRPAQGTLQGSAPGSFSALEKDARVFQREVSVDLQVWLRFGPGGGQTMEASSGGCVPRRRRQGPLITCAGCSSGSDGTPGA